MDLRRYLPAAIVLVFALGVVLYVVFLGPKPTAGPARPSGGTAQPSARLGQPTLAQPGDTVTLAADGDTVTLAAVDNAGRYGTIALTRGNERPVRPNERERADASGATTVLDVHIAYLPARASGIGFGASDWGYTVEFNESSIVFTRVRLPNS
jgi:hypothetical protein